MHLLLFFNFIQASLMTVVFLCKLRMTQIVGSTIMKENWGFKHELTPGTMLTFLPRYSLHNLPLESPWYVATTLGTLFWLNI